MALSTTGYSRTVLYPASNPAGKQFNEFVGATLLADGSIVVGWAEAFPTSTTQTGRNWSTTKPQLHYQRSTDGGKTWADYVIRKLGPIINLPAFTPQPLMSFADGSLAARDNGEDEWQDPAWSGPATAVLVQVQPDGSTRQVNTFGADVTKETVQISRMLPNRCIGGFRATGQHWPVPGGKRVGVANTDPYLVLSKDGSSFVNGLHFADGQQAMTFFNEWSSTELPNGDLFVAVRCGQNWKREQPASANRTAELSSIYATAIWPVRLDGSGWDYVEPKKAPFSTATAPIHPEVGVDNQTGALLFFSQGPEGILYSYDRGFTWAAVPGVAATNYYPRAVQTADGTWHVFSHVGGDDDINERDQQIIHQTFKLVDVTRPKPVWVDLTPQPAPAPGPHEDTVTSISQLPTPNGVAWTGLPAAEDSDATTYAQASLPGLSTPSNYIAKAATAEAAVTAVPDTDLIDEVTFTVACRRMPTGSNQTVKNFSAKLFAGSQPVTNERVSTPYPAWSTTADHVETFTFSRAAGDFLAPLTGAQLKDPNFCVAAAFVGTGTPVVVGVNALTVTSVKHSAPPQPDPVPDPTPVADPCADVKTALAAANSQIDALGAEITQVTSERDAAKAKIAQAVAILQG